VTSLNNPSDHERHVAALREEFEVLRQRDVGKNYILEDVNSLLNAVPGASGLSSERALLTLELRGNVVESLLLAQHILLRALLERQGKRVENFGLGADELRDLLITLHTHCFERDHSWDIFSEQIVLQVESPVPVDHSSSRLFFIG